ncbi:hypothetical protein CIG75_06680 [Tumebacillus algifaecis]|uniref:Lantibiotic dehydratase n=1 Tax=Tumebacillus algifaecis TaxID=1214604 RepID=A0A223CZB6_9BACL|nr:lantibiotic dehydratase [Tumebacillus algifaecis]ASS74688.1 hypothetical protein CIG75_06680 [Tumebacillus algifaecis]
MIQTDTKPLAQPTERTLFRPLDFFMLRSPVLPLESFQELFPADVDQVDDLRADGIAKLAELAQQPLIREAIAVASPSLLDSLHNITNISNPRKQDQAVKGFLRYLLRMMSRPTPFGLFSGVASGTFAETSNLTLHPTSQHHKRARPDMEWLLKVIELLEAQTDVVLQLQMHINPMIFLSGTRAKLPYVTRYGQRDAQGRITMDSVSVRATPVLHYVLEQATKPILFSELLDRVAAQFQAPLETVQNFLITLFRQEFLISELRPPTTVTSPLHYIRERIERLNGVDSIKSQLASLADKLTTYDRLPLGEGDTLFLELLAEMKALADVKNPLQVDLALAGNPLHLPLSVGEEAAKVASLLCKLSSGRVGYQHLEAYRTEFMERYGQDREVPLLELLDEDRGLGAPAGYEYPQSRHRPVTPTRSEATKKRQALQTNLLAKALSQGAVEVELTDDMVAQLTTEENPKALRPSLELYFSLAARSQAALDAGDFQLHLGPMPGSNGAGRTFGRFVDLFPESFRDRLAAVQEAEQAMTPDALLVEVSFLPPAGRATNVVLTEHCRPYELAMGTNSSKDETHTLPMSDLLVGCTEQGLYLTSQSLGRQVIPKAGHMLNPSTTPNLYRFLREIASEHVQTWQPFRWEVFEQSPFLPRVRYQKTVLVPAVWTLSEQTSELRVGLTEEQWQAEFNLWRAEWKLPRYVYLIEADNRILLDLDHPLHLEILSKEFRKGKDLKLIEMGVGFDELCLTSPDGLLLNEVVIPLVKAVPSVKKLRARPRLPLIPLEQRQILPGGEWLYAKLYGVSARQEELIGGHLREFCRDVQANGIVSKSYFIRYADPEPHIRLRFHGDPETLAAKLWPRLHEWASMLQKEGLLSRIATDTYDPEIERYGGPQPMKTVENLFALDSVAVSGWLHSKRFQKLGLSLEQIGAVSVIDYLESFGMSFNESFQWLDQRFSHKEQQEEFRTQRKLLLTLSNSLDDWQGLRAHPEGEIVYSGLQVRHEAIARFAEEIREHAALGNLYNTFDNIVGSVIHLHLNRLLGTDRERERGVMILARHALNGLRHFREDRR